MGANEHRSKYYGCQAEQLGSWRAIVVPVVD